MGKNNGVTRNIDALKMCDCTTRLKMLCDNLILIRTGLCNEDCTVNQKVIDNAIFVIEEEFRKLADKIEDLLHETEED